MTECAPLAALVRAAHGGQVSGFLADEATRRDILSLANSPLQPDIIARLHGRSVLLALPSQLATAAALIALDGLAGRIVLWPHDGSEGDMSGVGASASVDEILTTWPISAEAAPDTGRTPPPPPLRTEWVLLTSGTTGRPKLVVHTLMTLAGHLLAPRPSSGGNPVWATFYDIRRYGGLQILLRALLGGGSLVLSAAAEAPGAFLARAGAAGVTHMLGTPSHWRRASMSEALPLVSPVYVRLSGEIADQAILDRLRASFPAAAIVHAFASTEAGLAFEVHDGLSGFPAGLIEDSTEPAMRVEDGALEVRSARNALATLNGASSPMVKHDGFVDTGDLVALRNGRYVFIGRRDGVINVGGQKVHPEEVEEIINAHPAIQMSLVTARHSPIMGAVVVAEIVRKPSRAATPVNAASLAEEIRALCRSRLPPHKVPASIRVVAHLSVAATGKLVRMSA